MAALLGIQRGHDRTGRVRESDQGNQASEITQLLRQASRGNTAAFAQLFPLIYDQPGPGIPTRLETLGIVRP